jgi:Na+/H+-dicarboxylate symporter
MLLSIIPNNIFAALTQGDMLKALVFSLLFGLAIGHAPAKSSESLTQTLETIYHACQKLTQWFNTTLPLVLFSMVASQVAKTGLEPSARHAVHCDAGRRFVVIIVLSLGCAGPAGSGAKSCAASANR